MAAADDAVLFVVEDDGVNGGEHRLAVGLDLQGDLVTTLVVIALPFGLDDRLLVGLEADAIIVVPQVAELDEGDVPASVIQQIGTGD